VALGWELCLLFAVRRHVAAAVLTDAKRKSDLLIFIGFYSRDCVWLVGRAYKYGGVAFIFYSMLFFA